MSRKREPRAGEKRTPRAPVISADGLKQHKEALGDKELWQLNNRLEILEELRSVGVLNTPFIALEALSALSGALVTGRSEEQLQTVWPKDWGNETITVPLVLILALREVWTDYKNAPSSKTLGEAFQIEGGGQGKPRMKSKLGAIDRARRLAREVEVIYLQLEDDKSPSRLADAIQMVADQNKVSFGSVQKAHKARRKHIRSSLKDLEVLKGVKSSGS